MTYTQTFRQAQYGAFDIEYFLGFVTVRKWTTQFIYYDGDGMVKKNKPDGNKTIYPSLVRR